MMISAIGPYGGGDHFVIIYLKKISPLKKGLIFRSDVQPKNPRPKAPRMPWVCQKQN